MSPAPFQYAGVSSFEKREVQKPADPKAIALEAWAEGYMVGSLIILSCITLANMRGVLLHKLILLELVLGYWQGFYMLFDDPVASWWLSVAAIFLNASWSLHNVISWMKLRPFLSKTVSRIYIGTIILAQPYWIVEIYANFAYFHNINDIFLKTRPWEALCRDPWWITAAIFLLYNIKTKYELTFVQIVRISPRFAVMLCAMMISIVFLVVDILSVTSVLRAIRPVGINPFWKLSYVFKCLTDAVVLDDFKTALDRLRAFKISRLNSSALEDAETASVKRDVEETVAHSWYNQLRGPNAPHPPPMDSPDGDYIRNPFETNMARIAKKAHPHTSVERMPTSSTQPRDRENSSVTALDPLSPERESSTSHILPGEPSRYRHHLKSSAEDLEIEYAMAMREVAGASTPKHEKTDGV